MKKPGNAKNATAPPLSPHDALRLMRETARFTQAEIARALKINRAFLCRMELGKSTVSIKVLQAYARMCGFQIQLKAPTGRHHSVETGVGYKRRRSPGRRAQGEQHARV
ncbi:MAG: helix-turn-helix transcriptional regulator [Deltaproteobacteria bacterium]|nr:helix-turn-helix transcriptional regulator [Deltaproteobacteria bacterium]